MSCSNQPKLEKIFALVLLCVFILSGVFFFAGRRKHSADSSNTGVESRRIESIEEYAELLKNAENLQLQGCFFIDSELYAVLPIIAGCEMRFSLQDLPQIEFLLSTDSSLAFISSNCPDKVCINAGKLQADRDFAACLPNKTVLTLEETDKFDGSTFDFQADKFIILPYEEN